MVVTKSIAVQGLNYNSKKNIWKNKKNSSNNYELKQKKHLQQKNDQKTWKNR